MRVSVLEGAPARGHSPLAEALKANTATVTSLEFIVHAKIAIPHKIYLPLYHRMRVWTKAVLLLKR